MGWTSYIIVLFGFAFLFFIGAAAALTWAHRRGQLENLEEGSRVIFDDEEPEGRQADHFPRKERPRDSQR